MTAKTFCYYIGILLAFPYYEYIVTPALQYDPVPGFLLTFACIGIGFSWAFFIEVVFCNFLNKE